MFSSLCEHSNLRHFLETLTEDGGLESLEEGTPARRLSVHHIDCDLAAVEVAAATGAVRGEDGLVGVGKDASHHRSANTIAGTLQHEEFELSPGSARDAVGVLEVDETEQVVSVIIDGESDTSQHFQDETGSGRVKLGEAGTFFFKFSISRSAS